MRSKPSKGEEQLQAIGDYLDPYIKELREAGISVKFDDRDTHKPGFKFNEYELKGVPVRIAIGGRDMENGTFEIARRDTLSKESVAADQMVETVKGLLEDIQKNLFAKASAFREEHITKVDDYQEFKELLESKGGFFSAHWDGTEETEDLIKEETKATIRCIPIDAEAEEGQCVYSGKPSSRRVLFAKAY